MNLMSKKMAAAQALEGEFSADGLAAMAGEDNLQMALAKNLSEQIDDADMQRSWSKVKSGPKRLKKPTEGLRSLSPPTPEPSPLDALPDEAQLVAQTLLDNQSRQEADDWAEALSEPAPTQEEIDESDAMHAANPVFTPADPEPLSSAEEAALEPDLVDAEPAPCDRTSPDNDRTPVAYDRTPEPAPKPEPKPAKPKLRLVEPDPEPEDDDDDMPALTPEILAKMFGNLMGHNLTAEEFFGGDNE